MKYSITSGPATMIWLTASTLTSSAATDAGVITLTTPQSGCELSSTESLHEEEVPTKLSYLRNELVRHYLYVNDPDSALVILGQLGHQEADYILCTALLSQLNTDDAEEVLDSLPNLEASSVSDYVEMTMDERNADSIQNDTWYELLEWWLGLAEDSLSYESVGSEGIAFLQNVVSLDNSASPYAEAMMITLGVDTVYHLIEQPDSALPKRSEPPFPPGQESWLDQNIPNPFDEGTIIPIYMPSGAGYLEVHDLTGRLILQRAVSVGLTHMTISYRDLPAGTYTYSLRVGDQVVAGKKMIRQ